MEWDHKTQLLLNDVQTNLKSIEMWNSPVRSKLSKPKSPTEFDAFLPLPSSASGLPQTNTTELKEKTKTKGIPASPTADKPTELLQEHPPALPMLPVPRKTLTTLCTMFPSTPEERARIVDWDTFLAAMADAGFSARNGGGSMAVFHKPHPLAKIDPVMFQAMDRRMNEWFGWCRETFVAEEK